MNTFKHLETDCHVVGNESSLFLLILLESFLWVLADSLSKEFLEFIVLIDLDEDLMRLFDISLSEGSHTDLSNRSVVKNLVVHLVVLDCGANM